MPNRSGWLLWPGLRDYDKGDSVPPVVRGVVLAVGASLLAVLASLAVNAATEGTRWPGLLDLLRRHPWESVTALGVAGALAAAVAAWHQERSTLGASGPPPPSAPDVPEWVVGRAEVAAAIRAVCGRSRRGARTVAITTALEGAGGFGKTVLASVVCAAPRVRRHFRGQIFTVTIGRDVRGRAAVSAKVAEVTRFITGDATAFDDPELAGAHLGRLLDQRPRTLLVLDDVWEPQQLAPFLLGGRQCVRMVTTRRPALLPPATDRVRVDEMTTPQAKAVLTWQLPALPPKTVAELLEATGRWALLLRLTNRLMANQIATGADPADVAQEVLCILHVGGPAAIDTPAQHEPLDLNDPTRRVLAVRATVEAATTLLPSGSAQRLAELAIFAEDEAVPVPLAARLWRATAGLTEPESRTLCTELSGLSLISLDPDNGGRISLHDVLRDYLAEELGDSGLTHLHQKIIDVAAEIAPQPWQLDGGYLADHLVAHLAAAGRPDRAEWLASNLRWVEARLHQRGPTGPVNDLARAGTPRAKARARELSATAHLLSPVDGHPHLLTQVLLTRLEDSPAWRIPVRHRRDQNQDTHPYLSCHWTPALALPDSSLLRTLTGVPPVTALAVAPDNSWLATSSTDGTVRRWDPLSGNCTATYDCSQGPIRGMAVSPHGDWFVTAADDGTVRFWDVQDGQCLSTWQAHRSGVVAMELSRDGTRLVTTEGRTAKVWNVEKATTVAALRERGTRMTVLAISLDGTVVASAGGTTLHVWDTTTGRHVSSPCAQGGAKALTFAPDDAWLACGGADGSVAVFDPESGYRRATLSHRGQTRPVRALAVSPDSSLLAAAYADRLVQLYEPHSQRALATLTGHMGEVSALQFSSDGSFLVSAATDASVRLWEHTQTGRNEQDDRGKPAVLAVAFSPDGSRIAVVYEHDLVLGPADTAPTPPRHGDSDSRRAMDYSPNGEHLATVRHGSVVIVDATEQRPRYRPGTRWTLQGGHLNTPRYLNVVYSPDGAVLAASRGEAVELWDTHSRQRIVELPGHEGPVRELAFSPDGSMLAAGGDFPQVRVWDVATDRCAVSLPADATAVRALAYGPDGTGILATGGDDGTIRLWTTATCTAVLIGHTAPVTGVRFAPCGRFLASTSADGTARVWNVRDGQTVAMVRNDGAMTSCAWHPNGTRLAVGGQQGLYLYDFHR
ncbi:NB-ARC domain-containing protein [Streptomyces chartreusis]